MVNKQQAKGIIDYLKSDEAWSDYKNEYYEFCLLCYQTDGTSIFCLKNDKKQHCDDCCDNNNCWDEDSPETLDRYNQ